MAMLSVGLARMAALFGPLNLRRGWTVLAFMLLQFAAMQWTQAQQPGSDFDHSGTGFVLNGQHQNVRCETCHIKGVFKGTPKTCEACHGWNNPIATFSVMPTNHIPTGAVSCDTCHAANQAQFVDATRTFSHVLVGAQSCLSCHDSRHPHPNVKTNPSDPTHTAVLNSNQSCDKCHTTAQFTGPKVPSNHIPTAPVGCESCHTTADYTLMPTISNIHAYAPSPTSINCAQCHSSDNALKYTMPTMVPPLVAPPGNHIGMNGQSCEACHIAAGSNVQLPVVDGAKFSKAKFNHGSVTSGCATCHGPGVNGSTFFGISSIVVMPDSSSPGPLSHFPTTAPCESCHLGAGNPPTGQISAVSSSTVPGTGFQLPKPSTAQIHNGMTGNCASCHDTNAQWVGMSLYPLAGYGGFQSRPQAAAGQFNVSDFNHPSSGDCSQCHAGISFDPANVKKPSNHIPVAASSTCAACHDPANFAAMPTLTSLHANAPSTTDNCALCHSSANASTYNSMPTMVPQIVAPPSSPQHVAMGNLGCESCHVGSNSSLTLPVQVGAKFKNSAFSHSGIINNCASCHGASAPAMYGVVPKTLANLSPPHVPNPSSLDCGACHTSTPGGLIPLSGATGTSTFVGASFSHTNITTSCATCHGPSIGNSSFYGISNIVVMPPSSAQGTSSHIPSSTTCETCHLGSMPVSPVPGVATLSAPGTAFQTPVPTTTQIHTGITANCSSCHDTNYVWMDMTRYPIATTAPYTGFQTRPQLSSSGTFFVLDAGHPTSGDCSNCHGNFQDFTGVSKPANHIPYAASAACTACHVTPDYSMMPTLTAIHANAQSTTTNCAQCHSATNAPTFALPAIGFAIVAPPSSPQHVAMGNLGCESCHVGSNSSLTLPVQNGAKFNNSAFSHSGIVNNCSSCHGAAAPAMYGVVPKTLANLSPTHVPNPSSLDCGTCHTNIPSALIPLSGATGSSTFVGASFSHSQITTSCVTCHGPSIGSGSFYGISNIVVMPPSGAQGTSSHIPSSTACETCHLGSTPSTLVAGVATLSAPGTAFQTPVPTTTQIHTGITANCSSCHDTNYVWMDMTRYPIATTAPYTGFQTRPQSTSGTYFVKDIPHPTTGDCSNCHGSFQDFTSASMPSNHIPIGSGAQCVSCHTGSDYSVMPTLDSIHAYAPSSSGNCVQCHSATNAANYNTMASMSPPIVVPPSGHVDMGSLSCEGCHVGSNSSFVLPVRAGYNFKNSAFSHNGIAKTCATCHDSSVTAGSIFGVTPKTNSLTPQHVSIVQPMDCNVCHTNNQPTMLIAPTGAVAGQTTFAGAKFSHGTLTWGCVTCHGPTINGQSFYGISSIVVMPPSAASGSTSHLPTSTNCQDCHVGSVPSTLLAASATKSAPGSAFLLPAPTSAMIHNGITGSCSSCHDTNDVWMSVAQYPITTAAPFTGFQTRPQSSAGTFFVKDTGHPTSGDCSNCHGNFVDFTAPSMPANHIPVATTSVCTNCHTSPDYSIMPTLDNIHKYAPSSSTNCVQCHSATNAATYNTLASMNPKIVAPSTVAPLHVPMGNLSCENCHVGAGSSFSLPVIAGYNFKNSAFSHTGITSGCATCHGAGISGTSFQGITAIVAIPASTATPGASNHIPYTAACEACHVGSVPSGLVPGVATKVAPGTLFASPAPTTTQIHSGVTGNCSSCHETNNVWLSMAPAYNISTSAPYTGFQTRPQNSAGTFYVADAIHPSSGDCSNCHNSFTDFSAYVLPTNHIPVASTSTCANCHTVANYATMPTLTNIHQYAPSTTANCVQCHSTTNAATYNAMTSMVPAIKAPGSDHMAMGTLSCETCHVGSNSSIATLPVVTGNVFANSAFSHSGITGNCVTCHGATVITFSASGTTPSTPVFMGSPGLAASPNPSAAHVTNPGNLDCGVCHTSIPAGLVAKSGGGTTYNFGGASFSHSGIITGCSVCHGSSVTSTSFKGINKIVVLSSYTSTSATTSHIPAPQAATCETCHLGTTPSGLVAANATTTTWGATKFLTPTPSTAMIHTGITGNCATCHEANYTWADVAQYPRSPAAFVSGAVYTGFQTRPTSSATTNGVIDANHPTTGDCSNCHGSTADFNITSIPSNHIPIATGASCVACHTQMGTNNDFSAMPTVTNIHAYAQSTSTNCAQCHSTANAATYNAIAAMNPQIKAPGTNHVPLTIGAATCETCHVGTGSSIAATPVVTGNVFSGSKYSHSGITTSCATCHLVTNIPSGGFQGIASTQLVALPASTTANGASNHIPFSATCESCHSANVPAGLNALPASVSISSGGTGFQIALTSASNTAVHSGVTSGCNACHEKNYVWLGMSLASYKPNSLVTGTSTYTGFLTRPYATAAGTYTVNDAGHATGTLATADCSACHGSTSAFSPAAQPAGHIPTSTSNACTSCHATAGDYGTTTLATAANLHPGITVAALASPPAVPSISCVSCHSNASPGTLAFAGCTTVQASCAAPPGLIYYPKGVGGNPTTSATGSNRHVPIGTLDCVGCHTSVSLFSSTTMGTVGHKNANTVAAIACQSCHLDSSATMKNSSGTVTTNFGAAWTNASVTFRPSSHTTSKAYPNDCSKCHGNTTGSFGGRGLQRPIMRRAQVGPNNGRVHPNVLLPGQTAPTRGSLGNVYDHTGVAIGECKACHDGKRASGLPARHLMVSTSCDTCHRTSTWLPAQFSHNGVTANTCQACHNSMSATGKPAGHFMTSRSCDSCHKSTGWTPVSYQHLSPLYQPNPAMLTCVSCHTTNGEIIRRQMRALDRTKPLPVGP